MAIARSLWRGEVWSVDALQMADPESRVAAIFESPTDSQVLLLYGFTALVLIRILSYRRWRIGNDASRSPG